MLPETVSVFRNLIIASKNVNSKSNAFAYFLDRHLSFVLNNIIRKTSINNNVMKTRHRLFENLALQIPYQIAQTLFFFTQF